MEKCLKILLRLIALVAFLTGANIIIGGAAAVPGFEGTLDISVDNELRFFSVFWVAYGGLCIWVTNDFHQRGAFVPFIALVFFIGGLARLVSLVTQGEPSNILMGAMVLEWLLPVLIYFCYKKYMRLETPATGV